MPSWWDVWRWVEEEGNHNPNFTDGLKISTVYETWAVFWGAAEPDQGPRSTAEYGRDSHDDALAKL
jgi:hypothetical protein